MFIKSIGFDFFGTLVDAHAKAKTCVELMYNCLQKYGCVMSYNDFINNYRTVVAGYRKIRYEHFREINNCIWVADTLKKMGINADSFRPYIMSAVDEYFSSWQFSLLPDAVNTLKTISETFKTVLVSNFTNSDFLLRSLRKLGIRKFFDHVIVSDTFGWRKPHPAIFKQFLKLSKVKAAEAVFIGDDLEADIKGAKAVNINAVLLVRSGYSQSKQYETVIVPDHVVSSLKEFQKLIATVFS